MKVKVIGRDWKQTTKHILDEYLEAIKEYDGKYEEVELAIDDANYIIISDSDKIYNLDRDELEELIWKVLDEREEEYERAFDEMMLKDVPPFPSLN